MIPEQFFPFKTAAYELKIGASPIASGKDIFLVDGAYEFELGLKRNCLAVDSNYYCQGLAGSLAAQREVAALIRHAADIAVAEDAACPLRAAGDCVQEDLLILDACQAGLPLIAGHLCFANAWCLDEKMGKSFMEIHGPVPGFETSIGPSSEKLLERLKPGRPVSRLNWAVKATGQLDLTSRWNEEVREWNEAVDSGNAGQLCWMRAERQTLSRLEQSQTILFTVRTYTQTIDSLTLEQQRILLGVLRTCPEDMLRYKGILPFAPQLVAWLAVHCEG